MTKKSETLARIAFQEFGAPHLETRGSDRLDFYDVSVSAIRSALERAYDAGRRAATKEGVK